jgi:hypothetical protein
MEGHTHKRPSRRVITTKTKELIRVIYSTKEVEASRGGGNQDFCLCPIAWQQGSVNESRFASTTVGRGLFSSFDLNIKSIFPEAINARQVDTQILPTVPKGSLRFGDHRDCGTKFVI